ncbi:TPA: hypothetical protein L3699_004075 [Pseudomonas aeruginosa]|nr:hypothetical protein [Pseudomonas aeruginosa]
MTRNEYDEMEATANVALAGLLAGEGQWVSNPNELVRHAFDIAEAFNAEKKRRLGERPECTTEPLLIRTAPVRLGITSSNPFAHPDALSPNPGQT